MGLTHKKENLKNLPNAPKDFVFDLSNLSLIDGSSKSFGQLFTKNKDCCFIKVKKSDETFSLRRAVVRGKF